MPSETPETKERQARQRMLLMLQVQAGIKTATEAAQELGVSRQTFHQWEKRGMHALFQAMEEQPPGRPVTPGNPQVEELQEKVLRLEHQLAATEEVARLRKELLRSLEEERAQKAASHTKKKKPASETSSKAPNP